MPDKNLISISPLKTNDSAVCSLPLRLTVSGILFTVLLLISSVCIYDFLNGIKEREVLDEVSRLTAAAEQLSLQEEGSNVLLELNLPQEAAVDFGALPGHHEDWPADANNYCINLAGKTYIYSAAAFFSKPGLNGPVSLCSGRHRLLLSTKAEPKSGKVFVVISEKVQ